MYSKKGVNFGLAHGPGRDETCVEKYTGVRLAIHKRWEYPSVLLGFYFYDSHSYTHGPTYVSDTGHSSAHRPRLLVRGLSDT